MKIVIADDSALIRQRLTRLLNDLEGIEVVGEADDVPVAKALVETLKPDVAILDILMPTGSGADLVPELKKIEPAPKIIMLTNHPYPETRKKCISRGADYFFDKSTEFQKVAFVLRSMIKAACEKPSMLSVDMSLPEKDLEREVANQCAAFGTVKQVNLHLCRGSPLARPFAMVSMEMHDQTERLAAAFGRHALGSSAIIFLRQANISH